MPKVVDPERRRNAIADALFDVLREGGFANVTLASVAERAGLAIGSVRHFLGTREEMLRFAFDAIADRVHRRVTARAEAVLASLDDTRLGADDRLEATADLLCELLPLDATRRDEAIVWIEFETAARTDAQLAGTSRRAAARAARLVETVLESIQRRRAIPSPFDLPTETARLSALIDGLTLHCALHPDIVGPDMARRAVTAHLRELGRRHSS